MQSNQNSDDFENVQMSEDLSDNLTDNDYIKQLNDDNHDIDNNENND